MPFLTEVHFQNYRSFLDAKCRLSPVTLVIGANNAGKSNFLRGIFAAARGTKPDEFGRPFVDIQGMHPRGPKAAYSDSVINVTGINKYGVLGTASYDFERKVYVPLQAGLMVSC